LGAPRAYDAERRAFVLDGGVLVDAERAAALGARLRARTRLDHGRRVDLDRVSRRSARLEAREALPVTDELASGALGFASLRTGRLLGGHGRILDRMQYRGKSVLTVAALPCLLTACVELGAVKQGDVPYDPHPQAPDPAQVAQNPCRYGDVAGCIERCQRDEPGACNAVGVMFELGAAQGDGAIASGFYQRACEASYAPGCTNLAWLYSLGRGVPRDPAHSLALFTKAYEASKLACRRGDTSGCLMAGELLLEGRGVNEDEAQALAMFERACDGGETRGCAYVAQLR
jgi:hypothetical protein